MIAAEPLDPRMHWGTLTQAERDAAYNNRAATANAPELVDRRNESSARFRAAHAGHLDLAYGGGERTKWDIFPAADPTAPVLVFIHGGYWQQNGREQFAIMAEGAVARGLSVALPGYTLAPQATLSEIVGEIRTALDWLAHEGAAHGAGGPVILTGWSAGGHLTAMALDHPLVRAGVAISGVYELGPIRDTYLDEALRLTDLEIAALSPLRLPVVEKPLVITYGSAEVPALVHDSRNLHAMRSAAHAPGALLPIAGTNHFTVLDALSRPDGEILAAILTLAERLA